AVRLSLVTALLACAENSLRTNVRRFLLGLSCDELQFLAEFVGAFILESDEGLFRSRRQLVDKITRLQQPGGSPEDRDHKMILLFEFLSRTGIQPASSAARA